ncbi:hypothetical protein [Billgrantia desiderata]|uniref:hypothetical protein n=1 Tax=Billgrantia desiderata TaxID=52021 RepID=UPI001F347288|nr:hypothetical protein [Halomonas desiderata]
MAQKGVGRAGVTATLRVWRPRLSGLSVRLLSGGNAWNAGHIVDCPLDRTAQALAALRDFPFVGPRVGLYGVSRGAEHALLLTSLMARDEMPGIPEAVAAHSPPDVVCGGFDAWSISFSVTYELRLKRWIRPPLMGWLRPAALCRAQYPGHSGRVAQPHGV